MIYVHHMDHLIYKNWYQNLRSEFVENVFNHSAVIFQLVHSERHSMEFE